MFVVFLLIFITQKQFYLNQVAAIYGAEHFVMLSEFEGLFMLFFFLILSIQIWIGASVRRLPKLSLDQTCLRCQDAIPPPAPFGCSIFGQTLTYNVLSLARNRNETGRGKCPLRRSS